MQWGEGDVEFPLIAGENLGFHYIDFGASELVN